MKNQIEIGKDAIEILTVGMYEDSRFIFREYIQNAADQIDIAISNGLLEKDDALIDVRINPKNRSILIHDNATGIETSKVFKTLGNIASSQKDRTKNKGFRGIGRLGGLAYCKKLIFETSYLGEPVKSIMTWDASKLQAHLNDPDIKIGAVEVVDDVTSFETVSCPEDDHFFSVKLEDINQENTDLLGTANIREYLSMVAPVPFSNNFYLKSKIYDFIKQEVLDFDEYKIRINSDELYKGYSIGICQKVNNSKKRIDKIKDISFRKFYNEDGELLAWCWFGISNFEKQIPEKGNTHRGIRLRKSNIQIGSDSTLIKLHKEQRGNYYFVGEVHAVNKELIPNSRRDYFNENTTCKDFERELQYMFYDDLWRIYNDANKIKNAYKKIHKLHDLKDNYIKKYSEDGFSDGNEDEKLQKELKAAEAEALKSEKLLENYQKKRNDSELLNKVYKNISEEFDSKKHKETSDLESITNGKRKYRTQNMAKLNNKERKLISRVFGVIDKVLSKDMADSLKTKIEEEFK